MEIKTGVKAGNYLAGAQQAIGNAGAQVSTFVSTASAQAGSLASQVSGLWRNLTGKNG